MYHTSTGCGCLAVTALAVLGAAHAADTPQAAPTPPPARKALDLKPPDIRKLFTPEQIKQLLSITVDPDMERVEVEDAREKIIKEAAPIWRTVPSWLLPFESLPEHYGKPDATFPYRRPAAPLPAMAGEDRPYDR
jgi:hypothetical protein